MRGGCLDRPRLTHPATTGARGAHADGQPVLADIQPGDPLGQHLHRDHFLLVGVGPIVAATVLTAWSHPGCCRDDAAFATLAGAAPIPASSGKTVHYRLNRSGATAGSTAPCTP